MAHEIEMVNGVAQMAYAGEKPWHGLGTEVPADLTPTQMLEVAGLDWEVTKVPLYGRIGMSEVQAGSSFLVRDRDCAVLDEVSNDWNPIQNAEAFEFFNEFVAAGDMSMETAGSLKNGQIVWGLAKVNESFELFGGDRVESYLLFTNFHKYGYSTDVRFTSVRAVCNNTVTAALNEKVNNMVKINHRSKFDPTNVKVMLGVAHDRLAQYKEAASFLGSKRFTNENIVEYFTRIFPVTGANAKKERSRSTELAMQVLHSQPGAEYAEGSWWQAFNAVTYMTDHLLGRNDDSRLSSAWYGYNKGLKSKALNLAVEMAEAA
jgi:phage/plasmid-like protein (TIGR03299 family)